MKILINSVLIILISLFIMYNVLNKIARYKEMDFHEFVKKDNAFFRRIFLSLYEDYPSMCYLWLFCTVLFIIGIIGFIVGFLYVIIF